MKMHFTYVETYFLLDIKAQKCIYTISLYSKNRLIRLTLSGTVVRKLHLKKYFLNTIGLLMMVALNEPTHEKTNNLGFQTRSNINRPVQSHKEARSLKFWI